MATRFVLTPNSAEFPASNFPQLLLVNRRPALAFDAATAETCYWTAIVPQGWTGTITAYIHYIMASATSGKVDFTVAVEAVSDGDATDLDAGTSIDTANAITAPTVPGTAGYLDVITCTLTNNDSSAAADYLRIVLVRDATDGTNDTASGDCYVLAVEIRDGA
jgi:hypothetical protein